MGISFRDTATSFTKRFWGKYWQQRLSCALTGTSAARVLRMAASDRLQADEIATGGKIVHTVVREHGRYGYDIPAWVLLFVMLHSASSDWWTLERLSRMRYVLLGHGSTSTVKAFARNHDAAMRLWTAPPCD